MSADTPDALATARWSDDRGFVAALTAFLVALATIAGAWGSQLIGGLVPCELCYAQRNPYYLGLPVLLLVLLLWGRLPRLVRLMGLVLSIAIFTWGLYIATYHAGVEWGFWPGPQACGLGEGVTSDDILNMDDIRIVPCDMVQFRLFGISLAGYNALAQLVVIVLLGAAAALGRRLR